ncbi:MAG TPA: sialate O-acetylesterase [Saprospiraceae bacterium]|nr:sialate O-acetylesterase [Saprospiraceae bacterium]
MMVIKLISSVAFIYFFLSSIQAQIVLPSIFNDHMVLQQKSDIQIWGWSKTTEPVKVICSWQNDTLTTAGDYKGDWKVTTHTPIAGGPYTIEFIGYNHIILKDILIGEVWLCAGQSNMEWSASAGIDGGEEAIRNANQPQIRFFNVSHQTASSPQNDLRGNWQTCTPETMKYFSAVAYFFGKKISDSLNVPIGLIESAWGGTPAETWVSESTIKNNLVLSDAYSKLVQEPWGPIEPGLIYNAMILPLHKTRIAGAIWYQGESNIRNASTYDHLLSALIRNWREQWGYQFPFYYVQIAPFNYGPGIDGVLIQDSQRKVLKVLGTGMVVTNDIGNPDNLHPPAKKAVGDRLALWALHETYQQKEIDYSGPIYSGMSIEENSIRIHFDHAGPKLISAKEVLDDFTIAGTDQKFYPATAIIDGPTIIVTNSLVKKPVAVRFAWNNGAVPRLFNSAGLPASCFRTDDWKVTEN